MRWLYPIQTRLGLSAPEGTAALAVLLAVLGGTAALHVQSQADPLPADVYAAADAAFATADSLADAGGPTVAAPLAAPTGAASGADSSAAEIAEATVEAAAAPRRSGKPPPARTNINTASAADLQRLPRIGPALAQRIVDHRTANGPFRSADQIVAVRGIGERTLELLRPWSSEFRVSEFRVQSSEFRVQSSEFRVQSSEFRVQSSEFRVQSEWAPWKSSGQRVPVPLAPPVGARLLPHLRTSAPPHLRTSRTPHPPRAPPVRDWGMSPLPLAAAPLPFVGELAALFAAGVVVAYLCYRVRLVPIVGFLLAGVAAGPNALGLVTDLDLVQQIAEVGVILLLFAIGVEFSLKEMARLARPIFVGGGVQVGLTIAVVAGLAALFGVPFGPAVFTGFLVAMSSTAIVLKVLGERAESDTPVGKVALAMLLFQDVIIVVMALLVPILAGEGGTGLEVAWALGKAALVIAAVLVGARRVVPAFLDRIARTRRTELFLLAVAAICLGTGWAVSLAGVSIALGAFLAGLLVSESDYAEHALSEILPLQTLFTAAFFLSVGMLLDPAFLLANLPVVLAVAAGVLVLKATVAAVGARFLGYPVGVALAGGLAVAQVGEFSFVLALEGAAVGLTPAGLGEAGSQGLIAVTVVLMIATPFLIALAPRLAALGRQVETASGAGGHGHGVDLEDHTIVIGYGPAGRRLARVLGESGIPYAVNDLNPSSLREAEASDAPTVFGDASREPILQALGAERAKLLVVAINDRDATRRIVAVARHLNPTLQIFARTRFMADVEPMTRAGADVVVPEELETTVRLFTHVLGAYLVPKDEIERQAALVRQDDYGVLRGSIQEAHLMVLQGLDEEGLHTRAVAVREGAPAAGRTLADLGLRQRHGLTVMAVRRGRETVGGPAGDFRVEPGDRLVMVATADQFAASADLFRTP